MPDGDHLPASRASKARNRKWIWIAGGVATAVVITALTRPTFLFPATIKPLQVLLLERVDVPKDQFGARRLLAADVDGDGVRELVGINLPTAYVLKRTPDGWQTAWSGLVVPPEEATRWETKGEVRTAAAGRFVSTRGEDVALSLADLSGQLDGQFMVLQWSSDAKGLVPAIQAAVPKGEAPFGTPADTGLAVDRTESGLFVYGPQADGTRLGFQAVKWRVHGGRLVEAARGPALYPESSYANRAQVGWLDGRRVLALTYGLQCANCRNAWAKQVLFDAETLQVLSTQEQVLGRLVDGGPNVNSRLLQVLPNQVVRFDWKAGAWTLGQTIRPGDQQVLDAVPEPNGDAPRVAIRTPSSVQVWGSDGELLGQVSLPVRWPYQGTLAFLGDSVAVADRDGATLVEAPHAPVAEPLKVLWQGMDFHGLRLAGAMDVDGDGRTELVSYRGDVFAKGTAGPYRYQRTDPVFGRLFDEGWQLLKPAGPDPFFAKRGESDWQIARWEAAGLHELGRVKAGEIVSSWDVDLDGESDLIFIGLSAGTGAAAPRHPGSERVTVLNGRDLREMASFAFDLPVPDNPLAREMMGFFRGVPVPGGKDRFHLFANVPVDAARSRTYRIDLQRGQQPVVEEITPAVTLPGLFAAGGPALVGRLGPKQWGAVGSKYNAGGKALSLMQMDTKGKPYVQEFSLSEYGLGGVGEYDFTDLTGDGRAELLVSTAGQIYLFALH